MAIKPKFGGELIVDFFLPCAAFFEIITDKTERGGASELKLDDGQDGLRFTGHVGAIQGESGPVGFALARIPFVIEPGILGGSLVIRAVESVTISVVLGVLDVRNPNPQAGNLTYSTSFVLNEGINDIRFVWNQMEAKIRGRLIPVAPALQPEWANSFAIQIARSQQTGPLVRAQDQVPFDFTVMKLGG